MPLEPIRGVDLLTAHERNETVPFDALHRQERRRQAEARRREKAELAGPRPAPLERLLAERVVACWLHLHHLEAIYYGKDGMVLELARHYQRCIS
jgi:hypothetical protein